MNPILALLLAGQVASHVVPAEPVRQPPGTPATTMIVEPVAMALAGWDRDGDGRTTRAEMAAGIAASFALIEPRSAATLGYIGYGDWAERFLGNRNALPSPFEVDADGDDRISLAELQAAVARAFDRFDRDHDGVVTRAELVTIQAATEGGPGRGGKRPPR